MAGSGHKKVVYNSREKALSTDANRAQSFSAAWVADMMRLLIGVRTGNDEFAGTLIADPADVVGDPLVADVFEGLTVIPQAGSTSLHVIGGVVGMVDPDPSPNLDDSPYKVVVDAGISIDGTLAIAANASGAIRIDVIECQRTQVVLETDNRDVFDNTLGVFAPALVDKAEEGQLTYRVRQGTPAAGFPGTALGWLPLCVASVPNGSVNTDDVTFWDVRPLVSDRMNAPHATGLGFPKQFDEHNFHAEGDATTAAETRFMGTIWAQLFRQKIGGRITKGTPGGDFSYVDLQDSSNQEAGFAPSTHGEPYYVWAVFPENLPRWVRYLEAPISGQRIPFGFRGIIIVSTTPPTEANMIPATPLTLPTVTGLTSTTAIAARCIAVGRNTIGLFPGVMTGPGDGWIYFEPITLGLPNTPTIITGGFDTYVLVPGVDFPANARALKVRIDFQIVTAGAGNDVAWESKVDVVDASGLLTISPMSQGAKKHYASSIAATVQTSQIYEIIRLPPWTDPTNTIPSNITIQCTHALSGTFVSKTAEQLRVVGWRIE